MSKSGLAIAIITRLFAVGVITLVTFALPGSPMGIDTESSWVAVLNYAHQKSLQFGTDIVYSYGPLGFLNTLVFSPHAAGLVLAVNAVLSLTVAVGFCMLAWRLERACRWCLLGLFILLVPNIPASGLDLVLDIGLLSWGLLSLIDDRRRLTLYAVGFSVLAVFGALYKHTFFFSASLAVGVIAADLMLRGRRGTSGLLLVCYGGGLIGGWIMAGQNPANLGSFIAGAMEASRGYQQTGGLNSPPATTLGGTLVLLLAAATVIIRSLTSSAGGYKNLKWRRPLLFVWLSFTLFVAWKHGFIRADREHVGFFLAFVPIMTLALDALPTARVKPRSWALGLSLAGCVFSLVTLERTYFPGYLAFCLTHPPHLIPKNACRLVNPQPYWRHMEEMLGDEQRRAELPKLRGIIGGASVDVFGNQQAYAIFNDLNYRPRPVFQNYAATSRRMMRINERFYLSKQAPDYVLFQLAPIDHRFPPLEDALLFRNLLTNYELVEREGPFLLLKSRTPALPAMTLLREGNVRPGEMISVTEYAGTNLWVEIVFEPSLLGQIRQFVFKSAEARLAIWVGSSGAPTNDYRSPAPMLAAGFLASPLLLDNEDVLQLYRGTATRPVGYSVGPAPKDQKFWQQNVRFKIFKIENHMGGSLTNQTEVGLPDH